MSDLVLRVRAWWFWFRIRAREHGRAEREEFRGEREATGEPGAAGEPSGNPSGPEGLCRQGVETVPPLF